METEQPRPERRASGVAYRWMRTERDFDYFA
jgi:hypothetical protein